MSISLHHPNRLLCLCFSPTAFTLVLLYAWLFAAIPSRAEEKAPERIAVIQMTHETVTFLPNDTQLEDFIYPGSPKGGDDLINSGKRGAIGGFVTVANEYGAQLVGIESPGMPRTGTGSGWITNQAYEHFVGSTLKQLKAEGPFDGVYLRLHGAMAVRGIPKPEAELAKRIRNVVGPKTVIAATFDPHGNEDAEFFKHANLAFTYKYYPHYDGYLQGERAARTMLRTLRGNYSPKHAIRQVPILTATVHQWTGQPPWSTLVQRCLTWEAREPDVYINFFYGFPWADVPDAGMCFQVTTNGKPMLAQKIATDLAATAWRLRKELIDCCQIYPIAEAVALAAQAQRSNTKPVVLADYSDRSGNATWLLQEVIEQDLAKVAIATIRDDRLLQKLTEMNAQPGDPFDHFVGGYLDESAGKPIRVQGTIESFSASTGKSALANIRFGRDNLLVISPQLTQITGLNGLRRRGINPDEFEVFAIKSRVHFRRGFDDNGFAKSIYIVEPPGSFMGTVHLDALNYQNLRIKDFYPYGSPNYDPSKP